MTPDYDGSEKDQETIQEWISVNSFAARVFGAKLQPWVNFAIWECRSGLEEPPSAKASARDTHLATACEWVKHAGKELYEQGKQVQTLDSMEQRALKAGSLLDGGKPGLSGERFRFWRERIGVLGASAGSGALKEKAQEAVETMKKIEGSG